LPIQILEESPRRIKLLAKGYPLAVLNAIRRASFELVPKMAVDFIAVDRNDSTLFNEVLAHRLAMIPLTSEEALERYAPPEACGDCTPEEAEAEKCSHEGKPCYVRLFLDASADGKQVIVYSGDLKTEDPDVRPAVDAIPVVPLIGEQRVKVTAYARLGRGREHAKWMPATVAVVMPILKGVSVKETLCGAECQKECAEKCPEALKMEGGKLELKEGTTLSMLMYCIEYVCEGKGIRPVFEEDQYVLEVETDGSLSARRTLVEAARAVAEKLNALKTHLQSAEG